MQRFRGTIYQGDKVVVEDVEGYCEVHAPPRTATHHGMDAFNAKAGLSHQGTIRCISQTGDKATSP